MYAYMYTYYLTNRERVLEKDFHSLVPAIWERHWIRSGSLVACSVSHATRFSLCSCAFFGSFWKKRSDAEMLLPPRNRPLPAYVFMCVCVCVCARACVHLYVLVRVCVRV